MNASGGPGLEGLSLSDSDFALFGLPEQQALDRAALDARWRALQSQVHPDRFTAAGAAAQRVAMQWSVRVNEAYRRLKDPLQRASLLCERRGAAIEAESNTAMPAAFLHQQMAWREALDDAGDDLSAIEALDAEVAARERQLHAELQAALDGPDQGAAGAAPARQDAHAAAALVRTAMFVARFRDDIARRLAALDA
jgi:molecular chaperone HscB